MRKEIATFKALIRREASIEYVEKTRIKGTPGEVTQGGHQ
jgi:hypothetical protein